MFRIPSYRIVRHIESGCITAFSQETKVGDDIEVVVEHAGGPGYGEGLADVGIIVLAGDMFSAGARWARANPDKPIHSISRLMAELEGRQESA